MAYTTIDDPSAHFHIQLYVGNESTNAITNNANAGNFQPDWWWGADRTGTSWNSIYDSSRGTTKQLNSNVFNSEYTVSTGLTSFDSNGFTLGSHDNSNGNSENHVAWQWKANGGSRTTFTESGNNPGGGYQANTTAGFSIVDFTGTGGAGTVSHGLGAVPAWIIVKRRSSGNQNWIVYHHKNTSAPETERLYLDNTNATDDVTWWNDTAPTSSVFSLGATSVTNNDGSTHIAYCFAEKQGYSKFGSYKGNGNADGTFVYTGFKPALLITKRTDATSDWRIWDFKRDPENVVDRILYPSADNAEGSETFGDFLSNGFKIRVTTSDYNASGAEYIYMAFAEHPFVSSEGVPVTAR